MAGKKQQAGRLGPHQLPRPVWEKSMKLDQGREIQLRLRGQSRENELKHEDKYKPRGWSRGVARNRGGVMMQGCAYIRRSKPGTSSESHR